MDVSARRRVVLRRPCSWLNLLLLGTPLAFVIAGLALTKVPQLAALMDPGPAGLAIWALDDGAGRLRRALLRPVLVGLVFVGTVPRVLNLFITPDKVYPLYGFHYWVHRAIARTTNSRFYMRLFGDTSYIVHYLRWLGLRPSRGAADRVRTSARSSSTTPRSSARSAAERWSRTDCPSSTPISRARPSACPACRSGRRTSWGTGSPIPRRARRATTASSRRRSWFPSTGRCAKAWACWARPASRSRGRSSATSSSTWRARTSCVAASLAKNIHNTVTMALFLLSRWILFFAVTVLYLAAVDLWASLGALAFALATVGVFVVHRRLLTS